MSGLEIVGSISAIVHMLHASIKAYDSVRNDMKLPETFQAVRSRLPVILNILQRCETYLEPRKDEFHSDHLERILDECNEKARKLREIFETVIPGSTDTREKRYMKLIRRFGKGNRVEELMAKLNEDVQLIVNDNMVASAGSRQSADLNKQFKEMGILEESKIGSDSASSLILHCNGSIDGDTLIGSSDQQEYEPRQKDNFSFRGPVGIYLSQAPHIASELFIGRKQELEAIRKALHPNPKTQRQQRVVLGGMGGIGKTQLAIAYAESVRGSYSSTFWLNAVSRVALEESFRSIADIIFEVRDSDMLEDQEIVRYVHRWLCSPENVGWLMIFDNYDDPDEFNIEQYYPAASHGFIMVTTRRPDLVAGTTFDLRPLQDIDESIAVLATRSKRENCHSDHFAKRLAERLAGLPLALATAGVFLQRNTVSFERYLQEYEKRWNINPRRPPRLLEYQQRTLYTTWDLSYSRLKNENPDAANMLALLAYFDNQNLWYELFHAGITNKFQGPEWLRQAIIDDMSFNGIMETLAEYYFIDVHQASGSWSMHNCVHDWTLNTLNKEIDLEHYWFAFDCVSISLSDTQADDFANLSYFPLAAHATRLMEQRFLQKGIFDNIAPCRLDKALLIAKLLRDQVILLVAEQLYNQILCGYENLEEVGRDNISIFNAMDGLGTLYRKQGKLDEAEHTFQQALSGFENALGKENVSTLNTVNNLGTLYRYQDRLDEAEQMFLRALSGFENTLGPDHPATLETFNNLGLIYRFQEKVNQAEEMHQRALAGREKLFGPNHLSTLYTVNNLATLYRKVGKLDQAERMCQWALSGYQKNLREDHTTTLNTLNNFALLRREQGKLDQAEQMHQQALLGFEKVLGADHTSTLNVVDKLGSIYQDQGKLAQAEKMCQRALSGFVKALGTDHKLTLNAVKTTGALYRKQGKLDQAEIMHQWVLSGFENAFGLDHTSTLGDTTHHLEHLYRDQGK